MDNLASTKKSVVLLEFQAFLLSKKLVPEKNLFFYALWTSKYFSYARKKQINSDEYQENAVVEFIEALKNDSAVSEWQVRQAHDAIRNYLSLEAACYSLPFEIMYLYLNWRNTAFRKDASTGWT